MLTRWQRADTVPAVVAAASFVLSAALALVIASPKLNADAVRHAEHVRRYMAEHPAMRKLVDREAADTGADELLLVATIEEESEWRASAENGNSHAIGLGQHLLKLEPECRGPDGLRDEDCAMARDRLLNATYNLHRTAAALAHLNGDKSCRTSKTTATRLLCVLARYGGTTLAQAKRSDRVRLILAIRQRLLSRWRSPRKRSPNKRVRRPVGRGATTGRSRRAK